MLPHRSHTHPWKLASSGILFSISVLYIIIYNNIIISIINNNNIIHNILLFIICVLYICVIITIYDEHCTFLCAPGRPVETMPLTVIFQFFPAGICKYKFPRVTDLPRRCQKWGSLVDLQDCGGGHKNDKKDVCGQNDLGADEDSRMAWSNSSMQGSWSGGLTNAFV